MRLTFLSTGLYCLLILLLSSLLFDNGILQSVQAQSEPDKIPAETELPILAKKIGNMPLYLSLIEFYNPSFDEFEKAKKMLQKKQKIKLQNELTLNPFHQRNSLLLKEKIAAPEQSFCHTCHLPLPHQKNVRTRTFNNMHSRFIACETCHLDKQAIANADDLDYLWFDFNNRSQIKGSQDFFMKVNDQNQKKRLTSVKITPFYQHKIAIITYKHLYVKTLNENWEKGNLQARAEIKARTHQPLKFEGEACSECHTEKNSLLDMSALGANDEQLQSYQKNTIATFFEHYRSKKDKKTLDKKIDSDNMPPTVNEQESIQRIRITELLN